MCAGRPRQWLGAVPAASVWATRHGLACMRSLILPPCGGGAVPVTVCAEPCDYQQNRRRSHRPAVARGGQVRGERPLATLVVVRIGRTACRSVHEGALALVVASTVADLAHVDRAVLGDQAARLGVDGVRPNPGLLVRQRTEHLGEALLRKISVGDRQQHHGDAAEQIPVVRR